MDLLRQRFDPAREADRAWLPFSPRSVVPFFLVFAGGAALALRGAPPEVSRPLVTAGFHGSLLGAALASAWGGTHGWQGPAWLLLGLTFLASLSAQLLSWGALVYLTLPLALWQLSRRHPELCRIGLSRPVDNRAWLLGAGVGLFLGSHLLFSASRTLGYPTRLTPLARVLAAIAYDAGANVLSAELFFRGTIFNVWQRRRGFWAGAILSTGACLVRYLVDPALPRTLEVAVGALFYVALLSLASCALLARWGSLLPSVLAAVLFFGAYRALQLW